MGVDADSPREAVACAVWTLFAWWVVFRGGATWLEDAVTSMFVVHPRALNWGARGIRLYVGLGWIGSALLWCLGD
jgi:hypothetical protein